jgi:hypothetical protein
MFFAADDGVHEMGVEQAAAGSTLFFAGKNGVHGTELWSYQP